MPYLFSLGIFFLISASKTSLIWTPGSQISPHNTGPLRKTSIFVRSAIQSCELAMGRNRWGRAKGCGLCVGQLLNLCLWVWVRGNIPPLPLQQGGKIPLAESRRGWGRRKMSLCPLPAVFPSSCSAQSREMLPAVPPALQNGVGKGKRGWRRTG